MTVDGGRATLSPDPQASLRTELLGQLAAAQIALESAIAELSRSGADSATLAASRLQLSSVTDLMKVVGTAPLARLSDLRSEIAATAANAAALANQASGVSGNTVGAGEKLTPAQRARAAIESVGRDLFENRVLEPYLQFASAEDEEAYRRRERDREAEINRAMALHTPEGDRRAQQIAAAQLTDAAEHGGDRSPEFAGMEQRVNAAMADMQPSSQRIEPLAVNSGAPATHNDNRSTPDDGIGDILATLRAAGVTTPAVQDSDAGHGVDVSVALARDVSAAIRQG